MGIIESAQEFLTGRSSESKDLVTNYPKVSATVNGINHAADQIETTKGDFVSIIDQINNAKGVADYFSATLPTAEYEASFNELKEHVVGIGTALQSDADAAKAYADASFGEKVFATLGMAAAKTGEGFVSAFEDLGDGVVSLGGFVAANTFGRLTGTKEGIEETVGNFVKTDYSHMMFDKLYYSTDLAKKSFFTEDSGLAGAFNVVGKSAGYLYMGGALSGSAPAQWLGKTKLGTKALSMASSSTWGATAAAGIGGTGSGTESSLIRGNDFNKAFKDGAVQGAVQAGLAFGAGKLGEGLSKRNAIKEAQKAVDKADETFKSASDAAKGAKETFKNASEKIDELYEAGATDKAIRAQELIRDNADDALRNLDKATKDLDIANKALETAKGSKLSSFQGYTDSFTQAGQKFGAHPFSTAAGAATGAAKTAANAVTHPIQTGKTAVSTAASAAKNVVTHPIQTGKGAILTAASTVAKAATNPGVATTTAENVFRVNNEMDARRNQNPLPNSSISQATPNGNINETSNPNVEITSSTGGNQNDTGNTSTSTGSDGGYHGGGDGGSSGGGNSGGSPSYTDTTPSNITPSETTPTTTTPTTNQDTTNSTVDPISSVEPSNEEIAKDEVLNPTTNDNSNETTNTSTNTTQTDNSSNITPNTTSEQDASSQTITTPVEQSTTSSAETFSAPSSTDYTGGSYSEDTGYISSNEENGLEEMTNIDLETTNDSPLIDDASDSIEDIIQRGRTTKIPTSSVPIQPTVKSTGNGVIPIAAGLSAAAAAGIGAKAYIDHKNNSSYDDIDTEEWSEDDSLLENDESSENENEELSSEDEYSYQEETEKYGARNNEELADLQ